MSAENYKLVSTTKKDILALYGPWKNKHKTCPTVALFLFYGGSKGQSPLLGTHLLQKNVQQALHTHKNFSGAAKRFMRKNKSNERIGFGDILKINS